MLVMWMLSGQPQLEAKEDHNNAASVVCVRMGDIRHSPKFTTGNCQRTCHGSVEREAVAA